MFSRVVNKDHSLARNLSHFMMSDYHVKFLIYEKLNQQILRMRAHCIQLFYFALGLEHSVTAIALPFQLQLSTYVASKQNLVDPNI